MAETQKASALVDTVFSCCTSHLVFVTKFRHKVFADRHLRPEWRRSCGRCARDFETELVEFNGENNHVHLLVNFPPKVAVTKLVNSLKGVSSRRLRQEFPDLRTALLAGQQALVGLVLRRLRRRRPAQRRQAVHRTAEPPGLRHCSGLGGPPSAGLHPRPEGRSTGPHSGSGHRSHRSDRPAWVPPSRHDEQL